MYTSAIFVAALSLIIIPLLVLVYSYNKDNKIKVLNSPFKRLAVKPLPTHTSCRLYSFVEELHGHRPWGDFLDAGTGEHSLSWIVSLNTTSLTAVTGEPDKQAELTEAAKGKFRKNDSVVAGNWLDPAFLEGRQFDTVLCDYLLGSIEGFAPYYQTELFARLRPLVKKRLYLIGLTPLPIHDVSSPAVQLYLEIARARDASIILAGRKPYREYPKEWTTKQLELAGFTVKQVSTVTSVYTKSFLHGQIHVARKMLRLAKGRLSQQFSSQPVLNSRFRYVVSGGSSAAVNGMHSWLDQLADKVSFLGANEFSFGNDYVIVAEVNDAPYKPANSSISRPTPVHLAGLDH